MLVIVSTGYDFANSQWITGTWFCPCQCDKSAGLNPSYSLAGTRFPLVKSRTKRASVDSSLHRLLASEQFRDYAREATTLGGYAVNEPSKELKRFEDKFESLLNRLAPNDNVKRIALSQKNKVAKRLRALRTQMPGESPIFYYLLESTYIREIEQTLRKNGVQLPKVVFGTLPRGQLDGVTYKTGGGEYMVALNWGVFGLLQRVANIVSSLVPFEISNGQTRFNTNLGLLVRRIETSKRAKSALVDTLFSYIAFGNADKAPVMLVKGSRLQLSNLMSNTACLFLVAHEYAHIVWKHEPLKASHRVRQSGDKTVKWGKKSEEEADLLAMEITLGANSDHCSSLALSYIGIELLFACMELLEKATAGQSIDHPNAQYRTLLVRSLLQQYYREEAEVALSIGNLVRRTVLTLWEEIRPGFQIVTSPERVGATV